MKPLEQRESLHLEGVFQMQVPTRALYRGNCSHLSQDSILEMNALRIKMCTLCLKADLSLPRQREACSRDRGGHGPLISEGCRGAGVWVGSPLPEVTGAKTMAMRTAGAASAIAKNLTMGKRFPAVLSKLQSSPCPLSIPGLGGHSPFCLFRGLLPPLMLPSLRDSEAFFSNQYSDGHREGVQ